MSTKHLINVSLQINICLFKVICLIKKAQKKHYSSGLVILRRKIAKLVKSFCESIFRTKRSRI